MPCISPLRGLVQSISTDGFIYIENNTVWVTCPPAFLCDTVTTGKFKWFWG